MGTRHLTCVFLNGEYKVAQYGQWDGYPSGQGITVLSFLRNNFNKESFIEGVSKVFRPSNEQLKKWWDEVGHDIENSNGFVNIEIAQKFDTLHPSLSRDIGADILCMIQESDEPLPLYFSLDFAGDSLFCEWAYVIDLDKETFEIFKGFNENDLDESERFKSIKTDNNNYKPVKHVVSFKLNELPTDEVFLYVTEESE